MLSCQALADVTQRAFYYHWPVGDSDQARFGARFDELWEYSAGTPIDEPGPAPRIDVSGAGWQVLKDMQDQPIWSLAGSSVIPGPGNERPWGELLAELSPTPEVLELAQASSAELGERFVGVQVRAHPTLTHQKTLAESPVSWFIERMRESREREPGLQFFLSCDSATAESQIKDALPGVISIPKEGIYNSRRGLVESVADLALLSRAEHILAPYWSSFATVAWLMADKRMPLEDSKRTQPAQP